MAFETQNQYDKKFPHLKKLFPQIVASRRGYASFDQEGFYKYLEDNINEICAELNTRWLVSLCDTIADFKPTDQRASNAVSLVIWINMIKLWGTSEISLIDDPKAAPKLRPHIKRNHEIWDGVITYDMHTGDMVVNLLQRIDQTLKDTPVLHKIYYAMRKKMLASQSGCPLDRILQNHKLRNIL